MQLRFLRGEKKKKEGTCPSRGRKKRAAFPSATSVPLGGMRSWSNNNHEIKSR